MKVTVNLRKQDVEFLDDYTRRGRLPSRSVALRTAVRLLRNEELESAYAEAWRDWDLSGDSGLWESTVGDGLGPR